MFKTSLARCSSALALSIAAIIGFGTLASIPAHAQAVVASVNDDPITNVDIEQHMKILRVLRRNATHEAALEDIYETRLKLMETAKYKISSGDQDIGWALGITARSLKMEAQQLAIALHNAGVSDDQWKQKWKAEGNWMQFIRALNRTLEVSENEVRAELAKDGKVKGTEYSLRQVILVLPNNASESLVQTRSAEANQLRARFTDCTAGVALAQAMRDIAVKEPMSRAGSALNDQLRKILDQTTVGHLTPPSRSPQGIEMLAVCGKNNRDDSGASEGLRSDLLFKKLQGESDRRYREIRAKAIIVKR